MTDYPLHLAMAAIVRYYSDPARHFADNYALFWTRPNILFEALVAGLAFVVPINLAGKLVVSLAVAGVGPAALVLARRVGRPDYYALLALIGTYNFAFYWGFVGNLIAYPLTLLALAWADGWLEARPCTTQGLLGLAAFSLLFYVVHLQFLFLFVGACLWLHLTRRPPLPELLKVVLALLPGVVAAVLHVAVFRPEGWDPVQQTLKDVPLQIHPPGVRLARLPVNLFGAHQDQVEFALLALIVLLLAALTAYRPPSAELSAPEWLRQSRFALLCGWVALLYFGMPENFVGNLLYERLAALSLMLGVAALPQPGARAGYAKLLLIGLACIVFASTLKDFGAFEREAAGLQPLLAGTEPGKNLAGVMLNNRSAVILTAPVYVSCAGYYQALKGGRLLFSFSDLHIAMAQTRPERRWNDLLSRLADWHPDRFDIGRDGQRFDYFLVRGPEEGVRALLETSPDNLLVRSHGDWSLLERAPGPTSR
jgi:hypothetical protein